MINFILLLFLIGLLLATFWLHVEFWIGVIGTENEKILMVVTLFTLPLFPIFGLIELVKMIFIKNKGKYEI